MHQPRIIGRFAPTPSGPLHFGSLVTAVASYCHAKSQQGQWLLRIEDVDTPRIVDGSIDSILYALEAFGFEWDGELEYQSNNFEYYQQAVEWLWNNHFSYACECSRRSLREANANSGPLGLIYPGFCRQKKRQKTNLSIRLNTEKNTTIQFVDQVYGMVEYDIATQLGDFVLRRADGIYAYHLAVVIDDERQGINQIVRGADLLEATCLHRYLQNILGFNTPNYWHVPLVVNTEGDKLSKQTGAKAIDINQKNTLLIKALETLGQPIDPYMHQASTIDILQLAVNTWDYHRITPPPP